MRAELAKKRARSKTQYSSERWFVDLPEDFPEKLASSDVPICGVYLSQKTWTLICIDRVIASHEGRIQRVSLQQMESYCSVGLAYAKSIDDRVNPPNPAFIIGSNNRLIWVDDPSTMTQLHSMAIYLNRPEVQLGINDFPQDSRPYDELPTDDEWRYAGGSLERSISFRDRVNNIAWAKDEKSPKK